MLNDALKTHGEVITLDGVYSDNCTELCIMYICVWEIRCLESVLDHRPKETALSLLISSSSGLLVLLSALPVFSSSV